MLVWYLQWKSHNMLSPNMEQRVIITIPVCLFVQPTDSIPKTEILYHLRKEEMVVFKRN